MAKKYVKGCLEKLAKTPTIMYSRVHGEAVAVLAFTYAILQDQPERRKDLMLAPGASNWHAHFNYSAHN
jgi:hypothetical protein